jgi:hypothetical protein
MLWIDQITKSIDKRMHALTTQALDSDHWKETVNEFQRPLLSHKGNRLRRRGGLSLQFNSKI